MINMPNHLYQNKCFRKNTLEANPVKMIVEPRIIWYEDAEVKESPTYKSEDPATSQQAGKMNSQDLVHLNFTV